MNEYYVMEISKGDKSISGFATYAYDTANKAIASFHQKMSVAMKSSLYESELLLVVDSEGTVIKREKYVADTEE